MKFIPLALCVALLAGCGSSYRWRSSVPADRRSVYVPTFRNESGLQEIGAISARQLLREIQREGTFRIARAEDAAIEIQGTIKSISSKSEAYNRRENRRTSGYDMKCTAEITIVDKITDEVIVAGRTYTAETTFAAGHDLTTAQRDASGRVADILSRRIVDDILRIDWNKKTSCNKESK